MPRWHTLQRAFWESLSTRAFLTFSAAVAVTFASIGFLTDLVSLGRPYSSTLYTVAFSGLMAVVTLAAVTRSLWFMPLFVGLWLSYGLFLGGPARRPPFVFWTDLTLQQRLRYDMFGATFCMIFGYVGFVTFIGREGRRWVAVDAEMKLAREIHQTLVPRIAATIGRFEFYGVSLPSGHVGGDLVDLLALRDGRWLGYVADVSGHGVSSGLLMGMVKSAVRMRMTESAHLSGAQTDGSLTQPVLMTDLNRLIVDQSAPQMFVTMAAIRGGDDGRIEFTLAGHPPVLLVRREAAAGAGRAAGAQPAVEELSESHIPLGIMPDWAFTSAACQCQPGDLLAIVTDGLFEVFDSADQDFGLAGIKALLAATADLPLAEIADALLARVRAFGPQLDDQTLLLVRYR